ncbi:MAG: hypothetical protein Faunusvirus13_8 [Faunusvirus sp.]|uniref:Uncharacterized protein n=1 Tax=Faunusvirus sp. TaxID=2487766 RepID=A0A3G4ZWZ5_9VIRU|nr:MAG: hypothetical protein Faunusvirus13_8 [Faunusvirus sp.]
MQSVDEIRDKFVESIYAGDQTKCLEYINKYDNFYDAVCDDRYRKRINMLQFTCIYKLRRVAFALINKNCDLTYQDYHGYTALMYAGLYEINDLVSYIIDKTTNVATRCVYTGSIRTVSSGQSEMMFLLSSTNKSNIVKMIDRGYDVYYKSADHGSLMTFAIYYGAETVIKKLIELDTYFADEFEQSYDASQHDYRDRKKDLYNRIMKYCNNKRAAYRETIITTMNDKSPTNALYKSFHTTYAVALVDIICDFIILPECKKVE